MPSTILRTGITVVNTIEKIFALRAYIPEGEIYNKEILYQAMCRALGIWK